MNKNTRRARKGKPSEGIGPLSNNPEITIGTGERRELGTRTAETPVSGVGIDSSSYARGVRPKRYPLVTDKDRKKQGY